MSKMNHIGTHKTSIFKDVDGFTCVQYWSTIVVKFNGSKVTLNSGGHRSLTTKTRINQTAQYYNLGFSVYQKDFEWFVSIGHKTLEFKDGITFNINDRSY
jgi:hypothetical protein